MKHKKRVNPLPGQRIIRSVLAVWLCFIIYICRGEQGYVIFSVIAAMHGIQPYTKDMKPAILKRVAGTFIGAVWGLLLILLERGLTTDGIPNEILHYFLISLGVGVLIYFMVLLKVEDWAFLSSVTFMSITIAHLLYVNPYIYAFHRMLDTLIGAAVAELVNRVQLPRSRKLNTLFVSAIGLSILGENNQLSANSRIKLNRMIEDGAKFTVSTVETQARVRELLPGVDLRYPIIVMDGAALYSMRTMEYLRTVPMPEENARRLMDWLNAEQLPFFASSVTQNLWIIYHKKLANNAMKCLYEKGRFSPYRNFLQVDEDVYENILYVQLVAAEADIDAAMLNIHNQPWSSDYRVVKYDCDIEGYALLKIYDIHATRENMLKELQFLMGTENIVTFGGIPGKYDVYIRNADRDLLVKELRNRFEPIDWKNLKSIIRV
jgi:hydroxymethylpyrimidine pyrophosphatase-like HAD family hydrolase